MTKQDNTVKEFVYYHEAIVSIIEPVSIKRSKDKKGYVKIPESSFIYNKEVHFIEDNKIDLSKTKKEKLEKILLSLQHKLEINDRYKLQFKIITKCKKL